MNRAEVTLQEIDASIDSLASKGEFAALGRLLAEDFRYNHSTGLSQDNAVKCDSNHDAATACGVRYTCL